MAAYGGVIFPITCPQVVSRLSSFQHFLFCFSLQLPLPGPVSHCQSQVQSECEVWQVWALIRLRCAVQCKIKCQCVDSLLFVIQPSTNREMNERTSDERQSFLYSYSYFLFEKSPLELLSNLLAFLWLCRCALSAG